MASAFVLKWYQFYTFSYKYPLIIQMCVWFVSIHMNCLFTHSSYKLSAHYTVSWFGLFVPSFSWTLLASCCFWDCLLLSLNRQCSKARRKGSLISEMQLYLGFDLMFCNIYNSNGGKTPRIEKTSVTIFF